MVKIEIKGRSQYYDGYVKELLDNLKKMVKKDWDCVIVVDGLEGAGKSVFAQQAAWYLSEGNLTIDDVCFTPDEFLQRIQEKEKGGVVIFDEAFRGATSRAALSKLNKKIVEVFAEVRQKNLFLIIVIPSIFELDKYIAVHRSRAFFHVYTSPKGQRGYVAMYDYNRKKFLYIHGKKNYYSYNGAPCNKRGMFTKPYMVDKEAYIAKKHKALTTGINKIAKNSES